MADTKNKNQTLYGSGKVYSCDYDESEFPKVADFSKLSTAESTAIMAYLTSKCVTANRIGKIKHGYKFELTTSSLSDKDDLGEDKVDIINDETGKSNFELFSWDCEHIAEQYPTAEYSAADDGSTLLALGGLEHVVDKAHVIIFHKLDKTNGDKYVICVGKNVSGLSLAFSNENVGTVPVEIACEPLDARGHLCWFYTPATVAAAKSVSTATTTNTTK